MTGAAEQRAKAIELVTDFPPTDMRLTIPEQEDLARRIVEFAGEARRLALEEAAHVAETKFDECYDAGYVNGSIMIATAIRARLAQDDPAGREGV